VSAGLRAAEIRRQRGLEPRSARLRLPRRVARIWNARWRSGSVIESRSLEAAQPESVQPESLQPESLQPIVQEP
jgi:hypothetical protein